MEIPAGTGRAQSQPAAAPYRAYRDLIAATPRPVSCSRGSRQPNFLDEARGPGQIKPGALVVAGDEDAAAVCRVVDLAPAGDGTIVHLRLLPGLVDDYRQLVERALAS